MYIQQNVLRRNVYWRKVRQPETYDNAYTFMLIKSYSIHIFIEEEIVLNII